ncbi:MAG: peptidoglycan-associated lipoprotein Pal [Pseudomonadota bacterium]
MKNAFKPMLVAVVCLGLAACASKEPAPTEPVEPEPTRPTTPPPVVDRVNPNDYSDPRNLTEPDSLLSKRVIYFDFDQSTIRSEFRAILAAHGEFLSTNPNYSATLEGHADERGTREYNLGLGERRANAVLGVLDVQGASGSQLSDVSYGEERPVSTCSEERCWSQNRRVEIVYTRS